MFLVLSSCIYEATGCESIQSEPAVAVKKHIIQFYFKIPS